MKTQKLDPFFSSRLFDADPESDLQTTRDYQKTASRDQLESLVAQIGDLLADADLSLEELGAQANRWFGDLDDARAWLRGILEVLEGTTRATASVKDCNGAPLQEGDSVMVIKDLKVRGGSSDLKRGTLVKKIHLIDDPEAIECRVEGSTLVLKTCFLKKA